ncbi:MAG: DUF4711 domain-containing protein [Nitrosopumilus sp.]|nr:DUF4711 domain-containing protein [Nitrosopumilus sp.]MDH3824165.1 DUF4711 domain-containing protein [Nitrosopumilus sp.]
MAKRVGILVQVILCLIPFLWIIGFIRIQKLIAGILLLIGVAILVFVIQWFIPFDYGYALAWLVSFLTPIYYMVKWSRQWNDSLPS